MSRGMVTAAGGMAVYKVIAAETEPESAAEGTILVLTGTPMNKYSLRRYTTEITAPETGEVCFLVGSEGSYVEIDKKGTYATYITEVQQYDGAVWQKLTWYVRKDGEWAPPKTVLYSPGNTHGTITGGWSGGSLGSSYMSVTASNSGYGGPTYRSLSTAGKIDLTNYKVLCARVKRISGNGTSWNMRIGAGPSTAHAYQQPYYSNVISSDMTGEDTLIADVSQATGENYVVATIGGGLWQTSDTMAVYDVWLA